MTPNSQSLVSPPSPHASVLRFAHLLWCWLPSSVFGLLGLGILGGGYWLLLPALFLLGVLPLLDLLTGRQDTARFEKADFSAAEISFVTKGANAAGGLFLGNSHGAASTRVAPYHQHTAHRTRKFHCPGSGWWLVQSYGCGTPAS